MQRQSRLMPVLLRKIFWPQVATADGTRLVCALHLCEGLAQSKEPSMAGGDPLKVSRSALFECAGESMGGWTCCACCGNVPSCRTCHDQEQTGRTTGWPSQMLVAGRRTAEAAVGCLDEHGGGPGYRPSEVWLPSAVAHAVCGACAFVLVCRGCVHATG